MRCRCNLHTLLPLLLLLFSVHEAQAADGDATVNPSMQHPPVVPTLQKPKSVTVLVRGFRFSGNESIRSEELSALLAPWIAQECDLSKLREAARRVSDELRRRGNPFARAIVPPQTINDGIVTILVLEGRIGDIFIEGNRNYTSAFIRSHLLGGDNAPTIDGIERGLLHLNQDFQDLKVTGNFVPGGRPGTTDLRVKVEDHRPVHLNLSANNLGSDYVSRYRFGARLEWSNSIIPGSYLALGGIVGDRSADMHVLSGMYEFPVNRRGMVFGLSLFDGTFDVSREFAILNIHNEQLSGEMYLRHHLFRQRSGTLAGIIGFRAAEAKQYLLGEINSRDNTRVAYLQAQADRTWLGGRTLGGLTLSHGLGELFGGTGDNNLFVSRSGASNDFFRANLELAHYQPLAERLSVFLKCSGQWTSDDLLASEEWLVGGMDSVHGYTIGEGSGDRGYAASLSLRATPLENREILQLIGYFDYGYAYKRKVYSGSRHASELTGVGLGILSHIDTVVPADLRFDIGFPLDPSTNQSGDALQLYFQTSIRL